MKYVYNIQRFDPTIKNSGWKDMAPSFYLMNHNFAKGAWAMFKAHHGSTSAVRYRLAKCVRDESAPGRWVMLEVVEEWQDSPVKLNATRPLRSPDGLRRTTRTCVECHRCNYSLVLTEIDQLQERFQEGAKCPACSNGFCTEFTNTPKKTTEFS